MGDKGAGHAVEQTELIQGSPQLAQAQAGGEKCLRDVALAEVEILGEHVTQGKGTGAITSLKWVDGRDGGVNVRFGGVRPFLDGDIQIEGGWRVGEDLVRELVCDLLDEKLGGHVGRSRDGGERHHLTKRKRGGDLGEGGEVVGLFDGNGSARAFLVLELHLGMMCDKMTAASGGNGYEVHGQQDTFTVYNYDHKLRFTMREGGQRAKGESFPFLLKIEPGQAVSI